MRLFSGNRGDIYLIDYGSKKAVLKKLKPGKPNTLTKEARILKYLDSLYVPKLYEAGGDYIIMEYIEGISLKEALRKSGKRAVRLALVACNHLDRMGIAHRELGRYYHFIFDKDLKSVKIIDFERSAFCPRPRNVLQFLGFYLRDIELARAYRAKKIDFKTLLGRLDV